MYQNRATLIGFLGKDAGVHATKTKQTPYTILSLATKRSWKDRESGERMSETTWHKCVAWGKLADFAATLTKGAHLCGAHHKCIYAELRFIRRRGDRTCLACTGLHLRCT